MAWGPIGGSDEEQAIDRPVGRRAIRPVGLPDFDDRQRLTYLSLSGPELALASSRPGLHTQVWCALQIGYFKAKHAFFRFSWDDAQEDCTFVLARYFRNQVFHSQSITRHEHYVQRTKIAALHIRTRVSEHSIR